MRVGVMGAEDTLLLSLCCGASFAPGSSENTQLLREQNAHGLLFYFIRVPGPAAASPRNSPDGMNQTLEGRLASLCFHMPSRGFVPTLESKNHCFR